MFRGKNYKESSKLIDKQNLYDPMEALNLVCQASKAKFDETVELHLKLGVDGRHADQQVRGAIVLPNGTGKTARVLVFAKGDKADAAREAGADYVGDMGMMIPVVITVYSDRSFTFVTKTPPAALLIKKACGIETASGVPQRDKVATISKEDVRKIAEQKMPDLNCSDIESAISMIAGTCRSMGVVVGD